MVAYKHKNNLKELLTRADPYNIIIISHIDDEMHTYFPYKKRCDSCTNFVVTKISFKCFATKRIYKVRRSTSCVSKSVTYIAFCLNCLKQRVRSTVDWKHRLRNNKSNMKKKVRSCSIVNHFIDVCSDTDDPSRNIKFIIIDQIIQTAFPLMRLEIYCYKKKYFIFQRLSPYIKDLIAHVIVTENVVQNVLSKDRTYDN